MEVKKIISSRAFSPERPQIFITAIREGTFFIGGVGVGRDILENFCEKIRGPHTSQNGFMHDPSRIPRQKHLSPHLLQDKNNREGK